MLRYRRLTGAGASPSAPGRHSDPGSYECMAGVREARESSEGAQRAAKATALTALARGANCELSGVSA